MANELVNEALEIAGDKAIADKLEKGKEKRRVQAFMMLGGLKAADSIAENFSKSIDAQVMSGLESFQKSSFTLNLGTAPSTIS